MGSIYMKIDFSSLEKAVTQLQKSFEYLHSDLAKKDSDLREQFRAATIQGFEFSYELAIKMIRRQLTGILPNPHKLQEVDFADLMRIAADAGLIRDPLSYIEYREMRNRTSHTYNVDQAEQTVSEMDKFLSDMRLLIKELKERNSEPS